MYPPKFRRRRAGDRRERGAAALEFGLVLPLVMLVIFGIIQYGYLYWSLETAAAAAREAARRLVVGTDWGCTQAGAVQAADGPALGGTPPTVTRRYHTEGGATQSAPVVGSLVTVTVSFQSLDMGMPFLPLPNNGVVKDTAVGRIEDVPTERLKCDDTQGFVTGGTY
ncbi:MAG TPA: TadE family protein [Nocardioidaceae bacterium]|nr:TadE family protein [Nocardioidaceae bacterium]